MTFQRIQNIITYSCNVHSPWSTIGLDMSMMIKTKIITGANSQTCYCLLNIWELERNLLFHSYHGRWSSVPSEWKRHFKFSVWKCLENSLKCRFRHWLLCIQDVLAKHVEDNLIIQKPPNNKHMFLLHFVQHTPHSAKFLFGRIPVNHANLS